MLYTSLICLLAISFYGEPSAAFDEINLWIWTPENGPDKRFTMKLNQHQAKELLLSYKFDTQSSTKILVNTFNSDSEEDYTPYVKAYFKTDTPHNIIAVDWKDVSSNLAQTGYYATAGGDRVGRFLGQVLIRELEVDPNTIHIIGYSHGAHFAGHMGRYIESVGGKGKVARITALDPARRHFDGANLEAFRVNKGDAKLFDVIHTSGGDSIFKGEYSFLEPIGHLDFYPNGGQKQPGCTTWQNIWYDCSHKRANAYYLESIAYVGQKSKFQSQLCHSYDDYIKKNPQKCYQRFLNMGEGLVEPADENNRGNLFYLQTNAQSPYSK